MEKSLSIAGLSKNSITFLLDFILILFIYFTPALSHLFAFPIYYLDPMKIALVFAIIFTSKRNTFLIAITLPLFSYFVSAHPQFIKAILISAELLVNLSLFYYLIKKNNNAFYLLQLYNLKGHWLPNHILECHLDKLLQNLNRHPV